MRPLREIALEILRDWKKPHYTAAPYIQAMCDLNSLGDTYILDPATEIVERFLINAGSWRGETARRVKKELRDGTKAWRRRQREAP